MIKLKRNESVLNLLEEKDKYKKLAKRYAKTLNDILSSMYSIGAPLNDNILKFNKKQLIYLLELAKLIKYNL